MGKDGECWWEMSRVFVKNVDGVGEECEVSWLEMWGVLVENVGSDSVNSGECW